MHLIDDKYFVVSMWRRRIHVSDQIPNIIHFIIRRPILLNNVEGSLLGHPQTHITGVTRLHIRRRLLAVQHLGQDTRTGRFSDATRAAKQESVCQMLTFQRIFQRFRNMPLSHHFREALRPVLPRRYHILICHSPKGTKPLLFLKSDFRSPLLFFIFFWPCPLVRAATERNCSVSRSGPSGVRLSLRP